MVDSVLYNPTMWSNFATHLSGRFLSIGGHSNTRWEQKLLYTFLRLCTGSNIRYIGWPVVASIMYANYLGLHDWGRRARLHLQLRRRHPGSTQTCHSCDATEPQPHKNVKLWGPVNWVKCDACPRWYMVCVWHHGSHATLRTCIPVRCAARTEDCSSKLCL